jgi:hypothetical protein
MRSLSIVATFLLLAVLGVAQSEPVQSNVVLRHTSVKNLAAQTRRSTTRDLKEKQKDVGVDGEHRKKPEEAQSSTSTKKKWVAPVAASLTTVVVLGGIMFYAFRRKQRMGQEAEKSPDANNLVVESNIEVPEENKNWKIDGVDNEDEEIEVGKEI